MTDLFAAEARALGADRSVDVYVHLWHPDVAAAGLPVDPPSALLMLHDAHVGSEGIVVEGPLVSAIAPHAGDFAWLATHANRFIESVAQVQTDPQRQPPHRHYEDGLDPKMPHGTLRIGVTHIAWLLHIPYLPYAWASAALDVASMGAAPSASNPRRTADDPDEVSAHLYQRARHEVSVPAFTQLLRDAIGPGTDRAHSTLTATSDSIEARMWQDDGEAGTHSVVEQTLGPLLTQVLALIPTTRAEAFCAAWGLARRRVESELSGPVLPFAGLDLDVVLDRRATGNDLFDTLCERIRDEMT
ncbi:MAG: hypothetical protein AAF721_14120 [Myxococcota bacterium]